MWLYLFNNSYGYNKNFFNFFKKRFYWLKLKKIFFLFNWKKINLLVFNIFFIFVKFFLPPYLSYYKLLLSNMLFIDLCSIYKSYRHIFGLPVNGQRTWSNANSTYYSNLILRHYKLKKFSFFIIDSKPLSFKKVFLAEYVNFFWKKQFYLEWVSVKKRREYFFQKTSKMPYKIDYNYLVNCNIEHFFLKSLNLKKKKSHRKKKIFLKNSFNVGWPFGFSRDYLIFLRKKFESKKLKKIF